MPLTDIAWVGLAGAAGALARYVVDGALRARSGSTLPLGTMAINLSGSLLLGVLTGLVVWHHATSTLTLVAGSGFCGGYTTFSTASYEAVRLLQGGRGTAAAACTLITALGAPAAAAAGMARASL